MNDASFSNDIIINNKYAHLSGCTEICTGDGKTLKTTIGKEYHTYLMDHTFGGKCYVPATMIMELFAESALWFSNTFQINENLKVIGLEDFHVLRAIVMEPGDKIDVWINLKGILATKHSHILTIDIISERIAENGRVLGNRLNAKCNVEVAIKHPIVEKFVCPDNNFEEYYLPQELFYKQYFPSLGKLFHTQSGKFRVNLNKKTLIGIYNLENKEKQLIKRPSLGFVLSPLGYDTCLQYTVFLSRLLALKGRLPVSSQKILIYKEHPQNENCSIYVECKELDENIMKACFWAYDEKNELIVYAENAVVQYAPVNNTAEIYNNKEMFLGLLNQYKSTTT